MKIKIIFTLILLIVIAAATGTSYYFYSQYQKAQKLLANPTEAAKEEVLEVTRQLGKLMELPKDEEPTVATIVDKDKLKDQPFFNRAEKGDKVILYPKALKAIIYRPSINKVVDFAPINIGTPSAQTTQPVRVAVYNGTEITDLTQTFVNDIKSKVTNIDITVKENASKSDYGKTLVVDLTGSKADLAQQMAQLINGTVTKLPEGEVNPVSSTGGQIDLLVILGNNYTIKETLSVSPTPTRK